MGGRGASAVRPPEGRGGPEELFLRLQARGPALLLFSGGVDSGLLLVLGKKALGGGLTALTAVGPHTAPGEAWAAFDLARRQGVRHLWLPFDPLTLPDFRHNTPRRCYACKQALVRAATVAARRLGAKVIWDGTNLDDLADDRPGLQAAREAGVVSPLVDAGMDKQAVRELSFRLGLAGDKPAQSCLATRFPYHTTLTREDLARIGAAEAWLRRRGFSRVRLRVRGAAVHLELPAHERTLFLRRHLWVPYAGFLFSVFGFRLKNLISATP